MTGKIFRSCFLVGLAAILLCTGLSCLVMAERDQKAVNRQMEGELALVSQGVEEGGLDYLAGLQTEVRLTWIAPDGTVLYDSVANPAEMENHRNRAEVAQAMETGEGHSEHLSRTLLESNLYYAGRLADGSVIRLAQTRATMGALLLGVLLPVLWVVVLALILSGVLAAQVARQITRPINGIDLETPRAEGLYPELSPLVSRLWEQNLTIHRQMEELTRRQREFTALTENMSEGVLLLDCRYAVLSVNASAGAYLGHGQTSLMQDNCPPELWQAAVGAMEGNRQESMMESDGRMVEILASPVLVSGQVSGAILLMVDVTEREERESLRREFSANVSHELKTPLTAISGFAELMKEGMVPEADMREFAGDIFRECSRLIALVDDILKLSSLDEGGAQVKWEAVDLYTLAEDVQKSLRLPASQRNIALTLEGTHAVTFGAEHILKEMLYNLCDNAIKYNHENGAVVVSIGETEEDVTVSVADTGIGISPGQQERVFERFYRVDKSHSRRIGGTGLGLSIVKHGAQYHNAKLTLDSEPGVGTTITLTFRKERSYGNDRRDQAEQTNSDLYPEGG